MSKAGHVPEQDGRGAIAQPTKWEHRINSLVKTAKQQQQSRADSQAKLNKQKQALQQKLKQLTTSHANENKDLLAKSQQQRQKLKQSFNAQKANLQSKLKQLQAQHKTQKEKLMDQHEHQKRQMMTQNEVNFARAKTNAGRILQTLTSWLP